MFQGNRSPSDPTLDVNNETGSQAPVKAEGNYWGDTNPGDQVSGAVDYDPPLDSEPPQDTGQLAAPQNPRRIDVAQGQ